MKTKNRLPQGRRLFYTGMMAQRTSLLVSAAIVIAKAHSACGNLSLPPRGKVDFLPSAKKTDEGLSGSLWGYGVI